MSFQDGGQEATPLPDLDANRQAEILIQLKEIESSHAFRSSVRSKEFLSYVVEQVLAGHTDNLKERSIGVNLFHRAPTYDTGEDPIVRVKAGEVRRRLAEYYSGKDQESELQIQLPVGSYVPKFLWKARLVALPAPPAPPEVEIIEQPPVPPKQSVNWKGWGLATAVLVIGIAAIILGRNYVHRSSALDLFWQPLSVTKQPALICVPTPVGYAMNSELYSNSPAAKSGIYDSLAQRNETPLQLDPNTSIAWKEITPLVDFFVNRDDAYAAVELSTFFAAQHRLTQIRMGNDYTYEDIRSSPAILIGAYNNPWINRIMSDFPIVFSERDQMPWIEDRTKPGQVWKASIEGRLGSKDFALVARVLNSKTGQFLVIASGVGMVGTKAAARFITHNDDLEIALRAAPPGWERKNLEIVIETDIVDGSPSPPHVVALKVW